MTREPGQNEEVGRRTEPGQIQPAGGARGNGDAASSGGSWLQRMGEEPVRVPEPADMSGLPEGIRELRQSVVRMAREEKDASGVGREAEILRRLRAFFDRWQHQQRQRLAEACGELEESILAGLENARLALDRYERLTNDLVRLKARRIARGGDGGAGGGRTDGLSTGLYLSAIGFLGLVEFFANAPVFQSLLPRDPLTDRQIHLILETSQGWTAGAERVLATLLLRPDAALLAAGVVTFLCVLAHFFGHSLREFVGRRGYAAGREAAGGKEVAIDNLIPMILTGVGLMLVLGVLFEARVTLGRVGQERYRQDMSAVQELRREAGFRRTDGKLLEANGLTNRADDMEAAATDLREYAASMSRMSFPILLLNLTLVLCAITAAYFHRRGQLATPFDDDPLEDERRALIEGCEKAAVVASDRLAELTRWVRRLERLMNRDYERVERSLAQELEAVLLLYRSERARAGAGRPAGEPPGPDAFRPPSGGDAALLPRGAADAARFENDRRELLDRFRTVRERFAREALA